MAGSGQLLSLAAEGVIAPAIGLAHGRQQTGRYDGNHCTANVQSAGLKV
jgi:hypothetical protein